MSHTLEDLKRLGGSSGLYAIGEVVRRGLAFLMLPVYTRYLDTAEYGVLELLNALSSILFACLLLGLPSALNKVYHRDCPRERDRASLLATTLALEAPVLLIAGTLIAAFAEPIGTGVIGEAGRGLLVRLVVATAVVQSLMAIVLASFRARERAVAFVVLNLCQFIPAMALNIAFVVWLKMGVRGVLWGNFLSSLLALAIGLAVAFRSSEPRLNRQLVQPLLHFGLLLVPVLLATWAIDMSDRYVLRIYRSLEEVAVYGVGYKIGMVLQMAIVWPFQLAWPAVSFSISHRDDHKPSYARVLTYLSIILVFGWLAVSLGARAALTPLVGEAYSGAYLLVAPIALGYLFNGIHFCLSPGIHITGKTRQLTILSIFAAVLNLGLNFLVVPRYGAMGAAWTTMVTFLVIAAATLVLSQRAYPIRHEVGRLIKIAIAGAAIYSLALAFEPEAMMPALAWHLALAGIGFPAALILLGVPYSEEKQTVQSWLRRRRAARG